MTREKKCRGEVEATYGITLSDGVNGDRKMFPRYRLVGDNELASWC